MSHRRTNRYLLLLLPAALGAVYWVGIFLYEGEGEAWDTSFPWFRISLLTSLTLGFLLPQRWFLSPAPGFFFGLGQGIAALVSPVETGYLLMHVVIFLGLSLLFGGCSLIGFALRPAFWKDVLIPGGQDKDALRHPKRNGL